MENHKTYNSFVAYLRRRMIFDEPMVDELKSLLYERLNEHISSEKRLELLNDVYKLRKVPQIDVNYIGIIQDFFNYVKVKIEDEENSPQKRLKDPRKRKELTFKDLFFKKETADLVDIIFEENEYTKDGNWIGPGKLKKLATAFYVLKDQDPEINAIKPGKDTSQLRVFYNHYGINAQDKDGDVTLKNLLKRPEYERTEKPDYIEFMKLFNDLKKKK